MMYKGWIVTRIRDNVWKATKEEHQINVSSPEILRCLIDQNESPYEYERKK